MGKVVVLPPQNDFFIDGSPRYNSFINSGIRSRQNANARRVPRPSHNPNSSSISNFFRSSSRRRSPTPTRRVQNASEEPPVSLPARKNLVMGQVRILKRGEALTDIDAPKSISPDNKTGFENMRKARDDDLVVVLSSIDRLGSEPEMGPVQTQFDDRYAGSTFVTSPPPSLLPLPSFFSKKKNPTSDLRRKRGLPS